MSPRPIEAAPRSPAVGGKRVSPRLRHLLWTTLGIVTVLVVMAVGVFPTRQYLAQRRERAQTEQELRTLQTENAKLIDDIDALSSTDAIERTAREEHGYVKPLEENYVVVVPAGVVTRVPSVWPF